MPLNTMARASRWSRTSWVVMAALTMLMPLRTSATSCPARRPSVISTPLTLTLRSISVLPANAVSSGGKADMTTVRGLGSRRSAGSAEEAGASDAAARSIADDSRTWRRLMDAPRVGGPVQVAWKSRPDVVAFTAPVRIAKSPNRSPSSRSFVGEEQRPERRHDAVVVEVLAVEPRAVEGGAQVEVAGAGSAADEADLGLRVHEPS